MSHLIRNILPTSLREEGYDAPLNCSRGGVPEKALEDPHIRKINTKKRRGGVKGELRFTQLGGGTTRTWPKKLLGKGCRQIISMP